MALILTVNAGSSSLRFALYEGDTRPAALLRGRVEGLGGSDPRAHLTPERDFAALSMAGVVDHHSAIRALCDWLTENSLQHRIGAVAHRIVHGGDRSGPAVVDDTLLAELEELKSFAPLHQPHGLDAIHALRKPLPYCPQIACFDTSFHRTLPAVARRLTLPHSLADRPLRRHGFHGLSFEYIASSLPARIPNAQRVIVAHLGSGASMCALHHGRSVETSMGMTPLDGLPMGTRSGAVDPGVLLWLLETRGFDAERLGNVLYRESGLLGLSGISGDMRTLLESEDPAAQEAIDVFTYHCARTLGSLVVALGGLDAVVFTGGIGERAASVRADIIRPCAWLGLRLDPAANEDHGPCISTAGQAPSIWVIPTDEEQVLALQAMQLIGP
ncbi:MAG: acetate/propionate family kinase [Gammaproteobacteria bacterium]|nr:MAG: acetate/propionate family kinase [Gammaproteobacteria bacterium]